MNGCVYCLKSPSGKLYIGITSKTLAARWRQHRYNAAKELKSKAATECRALYNAIRKYGAEAFTLTTLATSGDWDELCQLEKLLIAEHAARWPSGYNLTEGGDGALGSKPSVQARRKMSVAQKKRLVDPVQRARTLRNLRDAVQAAVVAHRAMSPSERKEHGVKVQAAHKDPAVRAKHRQACIDRWTAEERAKQAVLMTGRKMAAWTPERKAAAAALRRLEWADPAMRARRLAGFAKYQENRT